MRVVSRSAPHREASETRPGANAAGVWVGGYTYYLTHCTVREVIQYPPKYVFHTHALGPKLNGDPPTKYVFTHTHTL